MTRNSPQITWISAALVVLSALAMLVGILAMPWADRDDDAGTVTGIRIATDFDEELDFAGRASHMFLIVLPLAAASALVMAGLGLQFPHHARTLSTYTLLVGVIALGYYYGAFFFEDRQSSRDEFSYLGNGFYVTLVATLGLIVQYGLARLGPPADTGLEWVSFKSPTISQPSAVWRWPLTIISGIFRWIGAVFGWLFAQIGQVMTGTPVLAYLVGLTAAVKLEQLAGEPLAELLEFRRGRLPGLFGATKLLEPFSNLDFSGILAPFFPAPNGKVDAPLRESWDAISQLATDFGHALTTQDPREPGFFAVLGDVIVYDLLIYLIPILIVGLLLRRLSLGTLRALPFWGGIALQIMVLYMAVSTWGSLNDYRELVLIYMGVNIMLSVSLNLVNGYMGEFSVGHAGFMAVGAYVSSVLTMWLFIDEPVFGASVINTTGFGLTVGFLIALVAGGVAAALAGLMVAFPSFRTRGDYLAIVTLAVNFIVTGVINNIEAIGGPRGLNGVPLWTDLRWIFFMTVLSVLAIYNLVNSTFGKGIIAIREDEIAAELMGVNTQGVKLVAFLVSSFIAGVSGGLFAHVLAYVNPGTFGILKSTEALVMVYLGGMGSITGSVIAAVIFTILIEAFRPLAVLKWVVIPLILILVMIFRPQGLFGFREMNLNLTGRSGDDPHTAAATLSSKEATDESAAD